MGSYLKCHSVVFQSGPPHHFMQATRAKKAYGCLEIKIYAALKHTLTINYISHHACQLCHHLEVHDDHSFPVLTSSIEVERDNLARKK